MEKLLVMFGSFNPLTNAHLNAMKAAVKHIGADKGLFVATNGQYLRRKTVKLDDPFYLSEDERKSIIESVCQDEPQLEFWGYELGGINPKRYKTLQKIQQQHPNATLFELQGADKVRTISKSANGEEYASNTRFVVFNRNDIELKSVINNDPILSRYQDHFTTLPPLQEGANISSTEVRRRFYDGQDYSDIIPPAAVKVLKNYNPSDFTISFAEKMQTIMRSGRFGINRACKEVYNQNTGIFNAWKNITNDVVLGNYQAFLDDTQLCKTELPKCDTAKTFTTTTLGCINTDCVDLAEKLIANGYNPAILNLASAGRPGGGYDGGYHAQEESLCQASNLSLSLYQFGDPKKLKCVRESGVPHKTIGYPLDTNFGGIYTPNVTFFRNNSSKFFTIKDEPFKCDVVTVAALSFNGRNDFSRACEQNYRAADGGFTPEGKEIMLNKIRTIFRLCLKNGKSEIILGAFGCGAYRLPVDAVVELFKIVINEPEFKNKFRLILFAILESTHRPNGLNGKFADFYREFGTYTP